MKYKIKTLKQLIGPICILLIFAILTVSCSSSDSSSSGKTLTLVTYDSFPKKDTSLNEAIREFENQTGIKVKIANAGDSGTMLSKAILTAGNPEGDVIWGIDSTSIAMALEKDIFEPYKTKEFDKLNPNLSNILPAHQATPVNYGDVCVNYDISYFKERGLAVPQTLKDLTKPEYYELLAVQNPASSSPGLAFLMASIVEFGQEEWPSFWRQLRANGMKVSESWDDAYYELFSGSSGKGKYPLVVSYATSPVAEALFSEPPVDISPTGNIDSTCFRQVEFAGILRGTKHTDQAQQLVNFLVSKKFQNEIPLNLFVNPARDDVELDKSFIQNSRVIDDPYSIDPELIIENRKDWIETWTQIVLN